MGGWAAEDWVTGQHGVVQRERDGDGGRERGSGGVVRESTTHCSPPSLHTARRLSAAVTEVCNCCVLLFVCTRARGGDDPSLFVGISGSVMWL